MASIKFFLKAPQASKPTLIYMYFMIGNERFKLSTSRKILPENWDQEKQQARRRHTGYAELNIYLNTISVEAEKAFNRLQSQRAPFSIETIRQVVSQTNNTRTERLNTKLIPFVQEYIERNLCLKTITTIKAYRNTMNHLAHFEKWQGNRPLSFDQIGLEFYDRFTSFLFNEKGLANNSVSNQIKNLKVFLNEATELGINKNLDFKKKRFKKMEQESESVYLNDAEIQCLFDLDLSNKPSLDRVRDLFIIGCWTGLRFSDFSQLKQDNIGSEFISIRTRKTDQPVMIPIHPMVRQIIMKYTVDHLIQLPNTISNQKMNDYLKEIARLAGLHEPVVITLTRGLIKDRQTYSKFELISSHCARRSFATNLYLQGFPSISIMKLTGHKSEKAFLKYIKVTQEENARKLMEFWKKKS